MSACGLHCCSHCWWSQGLFSQMNAPCISHDAMPICLFSAFILPRSATLSLSLSLAMSLSLNEIRKWFWRIWTIMFPDILKWLGQQIWKKILNRSKHRWVNIQKGGGHEIGGDDWFFFFFNCFLFYVPHFLFAKVKKGNKSWETIESIQEWDIVFGKVNETLAALFHLTWRTGCKEAILPLWLKGPDMKIHRRINLT